MPATATPPLVLVFPTRLPAIRLSEAEGSAPATSWIQVAVVGDYEDPRYGKFSITREQLAAMALNFSSGKFPEPPTEICVDYDHLTTKASQVPGDGKAAGWFKQLETRAGGDELWARVEWTSAGAAAIATKEYRFFSPYFTTTFTTHTGEAIGPTLLNGAITNRPFLQGMQPLSLALSQPGFEHVSVFALATLTDNEKRSRLEAAIQWTFGRADDCYEVWLVDTVDGDQAIFRKKHAYYVVGYAFGEDGSVTFTSDPAEVVQNWSRLTGDGGKELMATIQLTAADGKTVQIDEKALEATPLVKALRAQLPKEGETVVGAAEFSALDSSVKTLSQQVETLQASLATETKASEDLRKTLAQKDAEGKVDALVSQGKVLPAQRDTYIELALSNAAMFEKLAATLPVAVKLNEAAGAGGTATDGAADQLTAKAQALRAADPTLTDEQATAKALEQDPSLYRA